MHIAQNYTPLTEESAAEVARSLKYFSNNEKLEVSEIGDGNLNYVFRICSSQSGKSIIIKQALPYAKVVGESWPLTLDRARIESEALKKAGEIVPEFVPKVYHHDPILAYTAMEDLSSYVILRKGLIEGYRYPHLAKHIGTYLAHTLFYTSDWYLHPFEKKELVKQFSNPELCKITEDLVFTDPFFDSDTNSFPDALRPAVEKIWNDDDLIHEVAQLKYAFLTRAESLIHGDLHTGSIFVTENSTKIIDPEFAFYGPIGFDIGQFIANIILNAISQEYHASQPQAFQEYLYQVIEETWHVFSNQFLQNWQQRGTEKYTQTVKVASTILKQVWEDTVGFAGCEIIRRTIGLALVADLELVKPLEKQIQLKQQALELGALFIKERRSITLESLLQTLRSV